MGLCNKIKRLFGVWFSIKDDEGQVSGAPSGKPPYNSPCPNITTGFAWPRIHKEVGVYQCPCYIPVTSASLLVY